MSTEYHAEHVASDRQEQAGLRVFTDGEARRESWRAGLMESLDGVVPASRTMRWYRDGRELSAEETLSARAYPTLPDLIEDLVTVQIEEIEDLIDAGVRWVQLDSLSYNAVIDPRQVGSSRASADPAAVLAAAIAVDARIVGAIKRKNPGVTVGMHICRGNYRSSWMAQGSYEPVAERLFNEVPVDRFLLEYDTQRAGGFEPLRFVPRGPHAPTIVLGLITTKGPRLEDQDDLCRRMAEAASYVPEENLAISPQCGFASGSLGNLISVDDERRKLDLVVSTARKVWG